MSAKVVLGKSVPLKLINPDRLMKRAEALASTLVVPANVAFAKFEHEGRSYALSARLVIEVEAMAGRVPDVVIRDSSRQPARPPRRR